MEARGNQAGAQPQDSIANPFDLSQFGNFGGFGSDTGDMNQMSEAQMREQQRLREEKQRRERLRQQLHRQVNPVETTDIFNAREAQVKKQIDNLRYELRMLSQEIVEFHKEVDITIMSNVPSPGQEGKYYITFFEKLRAFIQMLRQQIHSARTWATTFNQKKKKKQGKKGMEISGQQYEQTATIFDQMHHERSTQYSGS
jgi:hypothetical protein